METKNDLQFETRKALKDAYIGGFTLEEIEELWEEVKQEVRDFLEYE